MKHPTHQLHYRYHYRIRDFGPAGVMIVSNDVPELDCNAKTKEEALAKLDDAFAAALNVYVTRNQPFPDPQAKGGPYRVWKPQLKLALLMFLYEVNFDALTNLMGRKPKAQKLSNVVLVDLRAKNNFEDIVAALDMSGYTLQPYKVSKVNGFTKKK